MADASSADAKVDKAYSYDDAAVNALYDEKPWTKKYVVPVIVRDMRL